MFKRIFTGLMAAAMLITTSCQKQEFALGQDATVTFEVATPEIATRAYSDGQTANLLQYAVYHINSNTQSAIGVKEIRNHIQCLPPSCAKWSEPNS